MAVVVNEMEVVPAAPESGGSGAGSGGKADGKPAMDPREVERAMMKQIERRTRVRAH